jgi:hypothetical protein
MPNTFCSTHIVLSLMITDVRQYFIHFFIVVVDFLGYV